MNLGVERKDIITDDNEEEEYVSVIKSPHPLAVSRTRMMNDHEEQQPSMSKNKNSFGDYDYCYDAPTTGSKRSGTAEVSPGSPYDDKYILDFDRMNGCPGLQVFVTPDEVMLNNAVITTAFFAKWVDDMADAEAYLLNEAARASVSGSLAPDGSGLVITWPSMPHTLHKAKLINSVTNGSANSLQAYQMAVAKLKPFESHTALYSFQGGIRCSKDYMNELTHGLELKTHFAVAGMVESVVRDDEGNLVMEKDEHGKEIVKIKETPTKALFWWKVRVVFGDDEKPRFIKNPYAGSLEQEYEDAMKAFKDQRLLSTSTSP